MRPTILSPAPFTRRLLHRYLSFGRGLTLGVRGIVVDGDRVFLVRHSYVPGWHLPGGGVEPGETLEAALARELSEEGNIVITAPPRLHGIFFNQRISNRDHVAVYLIREFRQSAAKTADFEILEADFFPCDRLPEATTAATRRRLAEALDGESVASIW